MARIAEVGIPHDKHVVVSLTYIYSIGSTAAKKILAGTGVSEDVRVRELTNEQTGAIRVGVDKLKVEGGFRREVNLNTKHLVEVDSYRGIRHRRGLPIRGQNTKGNTHTRKGPARAIADEKE